MTSKPCEAGSRCNCFGCVYTCSCTLVTIIQNYNTKQKYADDTVLFVSVKNAIHIENKLCADIQEFNNWLTENKCMVFGTQSKLNKCKPKLNVTIGQTACVGTSRMFQISWSIF